MKITKNHSWLCIAVLLLLGSNQAFAQQSIVVKLPASNQVATANVPAGTAASTAVVFYYVSKGNLTSQVGVEVQGPKGLEASVEASQIKGSALSTLEKGNFWKVYLSGTLAQSRQAVRLAAQVSNRSTIVTRSTNPICDVLSKSYIEAIIKNLSKQKGHEISYEEYCSQVPQTSVAKPGAKGTSNDEDIVVPIDAANATSSQPTIDQLYGSATGFLEKDNCASIKNYLVKLTVKLDKVSAAALAQGFNVQARLQEVEYSGPRVGSLKPISDGKYAPHPLLLMQSLGGGQWINLVKWAGGRPKILMKVAATPSLAFHRGYVLIRILADKLIAGGRGELINFELTNGRSVYNICGKRAKVRWRVNGYPE